MRTVRGGGSYEPPVEPGDGGRGGWRRPRGLPWIVLLVLLGVMVVLGLLAEFTDLVSPGDEAAKGPLAGGEAPLGEAPTATPTLEVETQQAEARETPTVAAAPAQSGGGTMTPIVTPGPNATATAGPEIAAQPEWLELAQEMLALINSDRRENGLGPVRLGVNTAPQTHAEGMRANEFLSHWGLDGLKPYMRYTLAGGEDYVAENVFGPACPRDQDTRYQETPPLDSVVEAQDALMQSPGHRKTILGPGHKSVSLGIACDSISCSVVQMFEGGYLSFSQSPAIEGGVLRLSGQLQDGFELGQVQVWYDESVAPLTLGQVGWTHSYRMGQRPAVFLRAPLSPDRYYTEEASEYSWESDVDPYRVDPSALAPGRVSKGLVHGCDEFPSAEGSHTLMVPWATAETWEVAGGSFSVEADVSSVLEQIGPGVYTVVVWGSNGQDEVSLSNYSVFVE